MAKGNTVRDLLRQRRSGAPLGIYSACSASEWVVEACLERAERTGGPVLIEATANQVDQRGGYTGMRPADFARLVLGIAERRGFPRERVILGGDHLGPLTWQKLPAARAMEEAGELVRLFVLAGFSKIHLDTSMHLGDDDASVRLPTEVVAARAAALAEVAEEAHQELRQGGADAPELAYVVGSEVPVPGGAAAEEGLHVTSPLDLDEAVETFRRAFAGARRPGIWDRTVAVVVQPGVEFGDESIHEYDRRAAAPLTAALRRHAPLVFEGHSTDYQRPARLREMVEDGVAILKVGPALTFALREGLLALECIEGELLHARTDELSRFSEALEAEMIGAPAGWARHYRGTPDQLRLKRRFSYSDRCRYYLPAPPVRSAIARLLANLEAARVPAVLLSQYLPRQYARLRDGLLRSEPSALVRDRIGDCIDDYLHATRAVAPSAGSTP